MDDPLRLIQYLYGEDEDESTVERRLSEDEALYREYERLRETKERLDDRPARRPDPAVVDEVVDTARAAAQSSSPTPRPDEDRPARPPTRSWTRRLQMVGSALALGVFVGVGWWQLPETADESTAVSAPDGPVPTASQSAPAAPEERRSSTDAVPAWDESDELVRIHRRVEQLQAQSGPNSWGTIQPIDRRRP
jgi:anti-sigma factor RsiW